MMTNAMNKSENSSVFSMFDNFNISTSTLFNLVDNGTNRSILPLTESKFFKNEQITIVERLTIYITFVVSIIGIIGNIFTVIVLNQRTMRKWRSSILLSALAIVDLLYLSIIFLSIIDALTGQAIGLHQSLILCQTTVYITHICSFLSANFTLSFTLQRFVAVLFPLHAHTIISYRSSIINILLLIFLGCGFYTFSFLLTNVSDGHCKEDERHPALFPLLIVDTCLTFIFPFFLILLFNCAIVYKLHMRKQLAIRFGFETSTRKATIYRHQKKPVPSGIPPSDLYHEREKLFQPDLSNINQNNNVPNQPDTTAENGVPSSLRQVSLSDSVGETTNTGNGHVTRPRHPRLSTRLLSHELSATNTHNNQQAISQRTTKMLVICSTTFLIFNSPYCAVLLYSIITKHVLTRTLDILRHFYFISFCLNFFLYSLCGNRFRHELIILLKTCCRKCCTKQIGQHWFPAEKFSQQSSFSHMQNRSGR